MNTFYEIVEVFTSFVEIFVLLLSFRFFAEKRLSKIAHFSALTALSASVTAITLLLNRVELVTLVFLPIIVSIWSISALLLYKTNFIKAFAVSLIYIVIITAFDFCVNSFIELFFGKYGMTSEAMNSLGMTRTILILSYKAVLILAFVAVYLVRRNKPVINIGNRNSGILIVIGVVLFLCMYYLMTALATGEKAEIEKSIFFAWLFLLMFVFGAIWLIINNEKERARAVEEQILESKITSLEFQINQSVETYKNMAELSHDHNNHLKAISLLMENQKIDEAKDYIAKVSALTHDNDLKIAPVTGINSVDAVINLKKAECIEKGIDFSVSSSLVGEKHISYMDFCSLLMNLLDNAIEGAMRANGTKEKKINLKISAWNDKLLIKVTNTYDANLLVKSNGQFKTTKEKKENHGYGIMIVKRIVEENQGLFNVEAGDDFCATVLI